MSDQTPAVETVEGKPNFLTDKQYDFLKWLSLIFLPAFGTLYFTLSQIWGLPKGSEVSATVGALVLFFGLVLRVSAKRYTVPVDGVITVAENDTKKVVDLGTIDFEKVAEKSQVTFRVDQA